MSDQFESFVVTNSPPICGRWWKAPRAEVPDSGADVNHICMRVIDHIDRCRCSCGADAPERPPEPALSAERAVRLLRAKVAELEADGKDRLVRHTRTETAYLALDIALIATLLADAIEAGMQDP